MREFERYCRDTLIASEAPLKRKILSGLAGTPPSRDEIKIAMSFLTNSTPAAAVYEPAHKKHTFSQAFLPEGIDLCSNDHCYLLRFEQALRMEFCILSLICTVTICTGRFRHDTRGELAERISVLHSHLCESMMRSPVGF